MKNNKIIVSIIIVNFNGKRFFDSCIRSIEDNLTYGYEVILVDNASTDGSADYFETRFPDLKLIRSSTNVGFSKGNNLAVKAASGKYLLLLNNDTVVQTSLDPLIRFIDNNIDVGVVGCRLLYGNLKQQESFGRIPNPITLFLSWGILPALFPQVSFWRRTEIHSSALYDLPKNEVGWVSGACLLTRKKIWDSLSGLDENFFMYMEDVDFCRRVGEEGFKIMYSSLSSVIHFEGAGRPWIGERALQNTSDSYFVYTRRYYTKKATVFLAFGLGLTFIARSLFFGVSSIFTRNSVKSDKCRSYFRVGLSIIKKEGNFYRNEFYL